MASKKNDVQSVQMSAEELAAFKAFQKEMQVKKEQEAQKKLREDYYARVDDEVLSAVPILQSLSEELHQVKETIYSNFEEIMKTKMNVLKLGKVDQYSHTFTSSDGKMRVILGVNQLDGYRDTVEEGIAMVRGYITSLARDANTQALVDAVLRLLAKDNNGNIKASRVLALRKLALQSKNPQFIHGVEIIEEAYKPTASKRYIRAEYKDERGEWKSIPLSMTDA